MTPWSASVGHNQRTASGVVESVGTYADDLAHLAVVMRTSRGNGESETALAFTDSVEPHLTRMLRLARRLGGENAEDIVQDALARAWAKRRQYDPARGSFGAWLLAITKDRAYKSWRWNLRHNKPMVRESDGNPNTDEFLDLERAVRKLPARQRLAVDCFYFVGLSISETAAVMGCSKGTVKSTLSSARSGLRDMLR
jgi:RNA polymerase sigma factor (sigma-70 family)